MQQKQKNKTKDFNFNIYKYNGKSMNMFNKNTIESEMFIRKINLEKLNKISLLFEQFKKNRVLITGLLIDKIY